MGSVVVEELALGDLEVVRVDAEAAYRSVGLRWDALAGTSVSLVARARLLDGTWTAWSPVDGFWEESSAHNGRWAPPGAADAFELKGGRGLLSHLVVELLAAGQPQAADGDGTATRAQALAPESLVNSRESWGAAPGTCTQVLPLHTPSRITIHHTVTPTYDTLGTAARLRQIQSYHQVVRGWCDIGYHFLVSRDGQLWQGAPDELRQGIHTANANDGNVGIAFLGNYETDQPTTTSLVGAQGLIQWLSDTYGIALDDQHLLGHLDHPTASTLCPGKHLYARLSELRDPATPPTAPPPATVSGTLCPGVGILSCGECSDPIDIEGDYLPHVVQCENGGADFEALKAQAIAARSYLYYALGSGSIQDSQAGQVYSCNATPGPQHIAAVAETTGLVLVNEYDATIAAFYVAGAKPSTPDCVALPSDPDPTNTEGWVTYQVPGSPVVPTPLGSLTNPKNRGCMSQNGARCLAQQGEDYEGILRRYYGYTRIEQRTPGCGAGGTNPAKPPCPFGDGLYCGASVGLDADVLYKCSGGAFVVADVCEAGCAPQAPGLNDACAAVTGPSCPAGDGYYCGGEVGKEAGVLYQCSAGAYAVAEICAGGCSSGGGAAKCAGSPPTSCPSGDGLYCGAAGLGQDPNGLYSCVKGQYVMTKVCNAGCLVQAPGNDDVCAGAAGGPTLSMCEPFVPARPVTCAVGCYDGHHGSDYSAPQFEPVYSPIDGTVIVANKSVATQTCALSFGTHVKIRQGDFVVTLAHLDAQLEVSQWQTVQAGQLVGYVSNTGYTLTKKGADWVCMQGGGYHLHLEVSYSGASFDPFQSDKVVWNGVCSQGSVGPCEGKSDGPSCAGAALIQCLSGEVASTTSCVDGCAPGSAAEPAACVAKSGTCPSGDGLYCGEGVGRTSGVLYSCAKGEFTNVTTCPNGCQQAAPGQDDSCKATTTPCPSGNGLYCGETVGKTTGTLYSCNNGVYSTAQVCPNGCLQAAAGQDDSCKATTTPCPSGNGLYCGETVGKTTGTLYSCNNGVYSTAQVCPNGCQQAAAGQDDSCKATTTPCPSGNGLYCGETVGKTTGTLYSCNNGVYSTAQVCPNGCQQAAAGQDDSCKATTTPCPSGNGLYCGETVGKTTGTLYSCNNGVYSTAQVCPNGCQQAAAGQDDSCKATTTPCPSGNGLYCGETVGKTTGTLYSCNNGVYSTAQVCPNGCQQAAAGQDDSCKATTTPCPSGNGLYCGETVGKTTGTLYSCNNGVYSTAQVCPNGCQQAAPGQDDSCKATTTPCPSGNGLYCGETVGKTTGTLYSCNNGVYSTAQVCSNGCQQAAAGQDDSCKAAPTTCPSGNGLYCGGPVGLDANTLYQCTAGKFSVQKVCGAGCQVAAPGFNDACK